MSLAVSPVSAAAGPKEPQASVDPRLEAFLDPACPEAFHSVASPSDVFRADPYDVEKIHNEPRALFESLLHRAGRTPAPPAGSVLVLLGEAGSGKTHLMGAFRTRAHANGWAYCGYLQLTTEAGNYCRYILSNLLDGLEQPYDPEGGSKKSGLARLSAALLEDVPGLSAAEREAFQECGSEVDAGRAVDDFADRLQQLPRYHPCDLELIRVMLHLERAAPQVRSRALMWLRCQEMKDSDRAWIGGAVPRTDEADAKKMLADFARLAFAVHQAPLVLLVDQLEDMANQSLPIERFRKVVDALTSFAESVPSAVVVMACLEDYYKSNVNHLVKAKHDRLNRDPEPMVLLANRTLEEVQAMTVRRLEHIFHEKGADVDLKDPYFPFKPKHLEPLGGMRTRDALAFLRQHHQRCITAGVWLEPILPDGRGDGNGTGSGSGSASGSGTGPIFVDLSPLWNDFHSSFEPKISDEEEDLAQVLGEACRSVSAEAPEGNYFECETSGRYLEIGTHKAQGGVDKRVAAVCNAKTSGPGLGKQIEELERRAGEIPVAVVRTVPFPKSGKVFMQVAGILKAKGIRLEAGQADRRKMLAFEAFRKQYGGRPDFLAWQKKERPLATLATLEQLLQISKLKAGEKPVVEKQAVEKPETVVPVVVTATAVNGTKPPAAALPVKDAPILLGKTRATQPLPVTTLPQDWAQHAAFLGGSGSGKTTAALNVIEQLLAQGIPAVLLDRKGDLCRYADPEAWTRPLGDPSQGPARDALRAKLDVAVYTPGDAQGWGLDLPIVPAGFGRLPEAERERYAQYAAAALGSMIGFKTSDSDKGMRVVLAKAIETLGAMPQATVGVASLRELVERQDDALVGAIGGGYPDKYYKNLAEKLLTLELNNKPLFSGGEPLDVDALLGAGAHARPGRARLSVISTRSLGDASKVDFWVAQLLSAVVRWCAKSPQPRLQAVFLFDEADLYLPAAGKVPATKAPMEDLLKRARSAGVGIFLATQSPGDLDYKCKENIRSWFLGRISEPTALAKLKPMLAGCKGDVADKLSAQKTGQFYLVREGNAQAFQSEPSLLRTEQLSEEEIVMLAARSRLREQAAR